MIVIRNRSVVNCRDTGGVGVFADCGDAGGDIICQPAVIADHSDHSGPWW